MRREYVMTATACALVLCVVSLSTASRQGASQGIALCENVIVPALLPVLILTNTVVRSRGSRLFDIILGRFFESVLRLPRCTAVAVIFGLVGGYPAGLLLTYQLYSSGDIDELVARRLCAFNFCGGVSFVITAVGTVCYGSTRVGVMLYLSSVISSVLICAVTRIGAPRLDVSHTTISEKLPIADALTESVSVTARALVNMCMYIVLFSAVSGMVTVPSWLVPVLEITNGVCTGAPMPLPYCSMFLCFGGLCVHLQLVDILRAMGVRYSYFLLCRIGGSVLAYATMVLMMRAVGDSTLVFSNVAQITNRFCQVNAGLSIVLVLGCAVLVLDIENKKSKLLYPTSCGII